MTLRLAAVGSILEETLEIVLYTKFGTINAHEAEAKGHNCLKL
jgi:hypothetical protein